MSRSVGVHVFHGFDCLCGQDLVWVFGFNAEAAGGLSYLQNTETQREVLFSELALPIVCHRDRRLGVARIVVQEIFYVSGQVGVVLDRMRNEQCLLQGHRHAIVTSCVRC